MHAEALPAPQPGDLMPSFFGLSQDGSVFSSEEQAGRPAVLILLGSGYGDDPKPLVQAFCHRIDAFQTMACDVIVMTPGQGMADAFDSADGRGVRLLNDLSDAAGRCRLQARDAAIILIDRSRRVALRLGVSGTDDAVDLCLDSLARLPTEAAQAVVMPAPVLMLPNLLRPPVCRDLIALFESGPNFEGRMASSDGDNGAVSRLDRTKKSRRDLVIEDDDPVWGWLRETVFLRCRAEIKRAFQADISCCDRLAIARYDAGAGWFARHRDNVSAQVAFREFAISINLNAGDYDGGCLSFPEYNDHLYRPQTGAGIIFSASVLHEATPVTRGSRYVLLTFFHGDAAENCRLDYESRQNRELELS